MTDTVITHHLRAQTMDRPPKKKESPISCAITPWLNSLPPTLLDLLKQQTSTTTLEDAVQKLIDTAPKRWVIYEPMVLLPSGSFTTTPWPTLLASLTPTQKQSLWESILDQLSQPKSPLTHLAINEGIPLLTSTTDNNNQQENTLRSPTSIHPLHGPFGPPSPHSPFSSSLWVSTKQNTLTQTWAPLHTMFSRGNIKEKARLLSFHSTIPLGSPPLHPHRYLPPSTLQNSYAVDLYAGIGYFVFSYARLGLKVLCWELNPWSVEGLRRGAIANKFTVRVITTPEDLGRPTKELMAGTTEQIVVFQEDNAHAARRIAELDEKPKVRHVNCGFLPTSEPVWRDSFDILVQGFSSSSKSEGGWLHLHENVGVKDIEARKAQIQRLFDGWCSKSKTITLKANVEHVEMVKTFAPDVWHVVFDVYVSSSVITN
ncbi:putative tRNA wybutosine-synthesizing protein 2 [Triangularia verruculosa]|uniref:tRNA wybutosine-synthesizing protein 2 n=1 Tax=Triangularia verruculosa TaxID=2587418 RepID=A0AAN6XW80_9PEZI|nr:putative tRNA wybutosine-synthesizing protein 2 [Triangularia verruculosa]